MLPISLALYTSVNASQTICYVVCQQSLVDFKAINGEEFKKISGAAVMHALGHIAANVSFAAVAISLSHTVKTLEPAFNCVLSFLILGKPTPLPVIATLFPIIVS